MAPSAVAVFTVTLTKTTIFWAGSRSFSWHSTASWGAVTWVQVPALFETLTLANVTPFGSTSRSVTARARDGPWFVTVMVDVSTLPATTGLGVATLTTERS